jgi:hypothetical protein
MHPDSRPECGVNVVVGDEAHLGIEGASLLIRGYLHAIRPAAARDRNDVTHEGAADSAQHLVGIDEQVLKLHRARRRSPGGEPDDCVIADRGSDPALCDRHVRKLEELGMGKQLRSIALIRERRPAEDVTKRGNVARHGGADLEWGHELSVPGSAGSASESAPPATSRTGCASPRCSDHLSD